MNTQPLNPNLMEISPVPPLSVVGAIGTESGVPKITYSDRWENKQTLLILSSFKISNTDQMNKNVWTHDLDLRVPNEDAPGYYFAHLFATHMSLPSPQLIFEPVKLSGAECRIRVRLGFSLGEYVPPKPDDPPESSQYYLQQEFLLEDETKCHVMDIPYPSMTLPIRLYASHTDSPFIGKPALFDVPQVVINVSIVSQYLPTPIHPDVFDVNVYLKLNPTYTGNIIPGTAKPLFFSFGGVRKSITTDVPRLRFPVYSP